MRHAIINFFMTSKTVAQNQALKTTSVLFLRFAAAKGAVEATLKKSAVREILIANAGIPVVAYALFGLTRLPDELAAKIAISSALILLIINILHIAKFSNFRRLCITLFILNAVSVVFLSAISFIDGLYYAIPLIF